MGPLINLLACTALVLLSNAPAALAAKQSVTDRVYVACNTDTFDSNGISNFNAVVQSLTQNSSKTLYSTAISKSGNSNTSYVYGFYQCRGDVSLSDCSSCVSYALSHITTGLGGCGHAAIGARGQYQGCYIRYEISDFSGFEKSNVQYSTCSPLNDSSPIYQNNLATALKDTASAAPKHALFGYNASSVGTGSTAAYALSQCVAYISPSECATCLSAVSNYSLLCNNAVSGEVYFVDCYYLYGNSSILFTENNSTSM